MRACVTLRWACLAALLTSTNCELVLGLENTVATGQDGPSAGGTTPDAAVEAGSAGAAVGGAGAGAENPTSNTPSSDSNGGARDDAQGGGNAGEGISAAAGAAPSGGTPGDLSCSPSRCPVDSACAKDDACLDRRWANWKMPNPANSSTAPALNVATLLPNPSNYDTSLPGVVSDRITLLDWQRDATSALLNWADALSYCDELRLGNHDDWRLPTRIELVSLVDFSRADPALDVTAFPRTLAAPFWTASRAVDDPTLRWVVDFSVGLSDEASADRLIGVRCVR